MVALKAPVVGLRTMIVRGNVRRPTTECKMEYPDQDGIVESGELVEDPRVRSIEDSRVPCQVDGDDTLAGSRIHTAIQG